MDRNLNAGVGLHDMYINATSVRNVIKLDDNFFTFASYANYTSNAWLKIYLTTSVANFLFGYHS